MHHQIKSRMSTGNMNYTTVWICNPYLSLFAFWFVFNSLETKCEPTLKLDKLDHLEVKGQKKAQIKHLSQFLISVICERITM